MIETRAHVSVGEVHAYPVPEVPPLAAGLIAHVTRYEQLGVEAALYGDRDRVVRALLAHQLVGQYDKAQILADRLIAENQDWLPWAP